MKEHPHDPKDVHNDRVPATTYIWMIPYITRIARRHGYAVGVHGSMGRDLDLIMVPWVADANEPKDLLDEICRLMDGSLVNTTDQIPRAHGRTTYNIVFNRAWHFLDISFTPLIK